LINSSEERALRNSWIAEKRVVVEDAKPGMMGVSMKLVSLVTVRIELAQTRERC
jgi:hypothetical protein